MAHRLIPSPGHTHEELIEWIEAVLRLTGWSSSHLAKEAGVAASTVNRFLAGAQHLLSSTTVGRIEMAVERRVRERLAREEITIPGEFLTKGGDAADRMIMIPEVDPREGGSKMEQTSWGFPEKWFKFTYGSNPTDCQIVPIEDDAMFNELRTGDRVVVDMRRTAPSPSGVFLLDDGVSWTPRHLELLPGVEPPTVMISARNPDYRNREAPLDSLKIVGRVIGMWRRL